VVRKTITFLLPEDAHSDDVAVVLLTPEGDIAEWLERVPAVVNGRDLPARLELNLCCFCGQDFGQFGNNPEPLVAFDEGRCCNDCNSSRVIPARLSQLNLAQRNMGAT
jgi:hypothetical protein